MNLSLLLDMAAGAFPDRRAFGSAREGLTFSELQSRAQSGAGALDAGDKVAFLGLNGEAFPIALFGSAMRGKPFAPLNYRLRDDALRRLVERLAPAALIVDDDMSPRVEGIPGVTLIARSAFEAACASGAPNGFAEGGDVAILLFTSGTTGEPKAAILRHEQLTSYVLSTVELGAAGEEEAALVSVPPYHIAGISAVLTGVFAARRTFYLPAFTPESWVAAAADEKVTQAMVVPTMLGRILDELERRGGALPHLRALSYGGGRMPQPVIMRALRMLPDVGFVNAYGLTETSSTIAILGPEDHRRALHDDAAHRRLASVGRPLPSVEIEIRGPDGLPNPAGVAGEIFVRGPQIAGEYTHRKAIDADGWFATNDGGYLDEQGYLFVEGRLDDVIVRGGENISPGEVEDVLRTHPAVEDVAVVGLPDDQWGEKIAAVVVARDDHLAEAELSAWVREHLRSTKTPDTWVFASSLPYNETGKLLRRSLRADLLADHES